MRIVACLLAWMALALCGLAGAETIRVAAEDDWPPYSSAVGPERRPEGFAVDLVREVFASQGIKVEFVAVPFARCLAYTIKGRVVGCFNVTMTRANRHEHIWHAAPMMEEELSIFARADASASAKEIGLADLRHHAVGYTMGYTYPTDLMSDPLITRYSASSDHQLLKMLLAGRVDYILLNRLPGMLRIAGDPAFSGKVQRVGRVSMDGFWLAFSKAHPDGQRLSGVFEQGLRQFKHDGRYQTMVQAFRRRLGVQ